MASTYLTRTMTGSPTSNQKGTMSYWFKRSKLGTYQFLGQITPGSAGTAGADLNSNDRWTFYWALDGSWDWLHTTRRFRDTSAWYHIVFNWDSTLATSGDRLQLWVNGVRETAFEDEVQPAQNATTTIGSAATYNINAWGSASYFDGSMTHYHYIDGTAYPASAFGEFDATSGEWKIKTSPSVTYGNQGFFILKDGNSVTDQSGNGNNWTVGGGTLTNTEDNPSDIFATFNPLTFAGSKWTLANGNTSTNGIPSTNAWRFLISTLGATKGKYYFETKVTNIESGDPGNIIFGITDIDQVSQAEDNGKFSAASRGYGYRASTGYKCNNGSEVAYGATYTTGDIIGCAFDLDNNKIYFSKNGTWQDSGDPTSGATGTGSAYDLTDGYFYTPAFSSYYSNEKYSVNFGNGYFGTTAVSSAGTNASGIGIFEYDVPTGYTALSTKGLNA